MLKANATETHEAMSMCSIPMATKIKGVMVIVHVNKGVAKFISVASSMVYFAVLWMLVSFSSVKSAFSRSEIFRSCSRLSAS